VDGDHSYEGARADVDRWGDLVRAGGHLVFHDAIDRGGYGNVYPGITRLTAELDREPVWARLADTGTMAHYTRVA